MTQRDNILQELKELESRLADTLPQNVYTIPAGYFDDLVARVLDRIKILEASTATEELNYLSPMLGKISRQIPYSVPSDYFETLEQNILQSVRESNQYQTAKEELETISPLLSSLKKQTPYTVPQGYFDTLVPGKPAAKVISFTSRKWFRYAAAAVVTGLVVLAGFLYFGEEKTPGGKALAKFTRDVKKMDETQKDHLIDFIDAGMNGNETAQVNTDTKSNEVKDLLQGVSDEELKDFQQQTEDIQEVLMTN